MAAVTVADICRALECAVPDGCGGIPLDRIDSLDHADSRAVTFIVHPRYNPAAAASKAAAFIVRTGHALEGRPCLQVKDPYLGYALAARVFEDRSPVFGAGISGRAHIDPSATLASDVHVGPGTVIGAGCSVGAGTEIGARVVIEKGCVIGENCRIDSGAVIRRGCVLGSRVIIQANAVIGSEGFGNAKDGPAFVRIPCFGNVVIEDDVEIGAGTTVDRGNFQPTVIRRGARLDNLIMIAHNVEIGEHTAIAAQAGLSGSTTVGNRVIIAGQAGFAGHMSIGDDSFVGAQAGVAKSLPPGSKVTGTPARGLMDMRRQEAAGARVPELIKEVRRLRDELEAIKAKTDTTP